MNILFVLYETFRNFINAVTTTNYPIILINFETNLKMYIEIIIDIFKEKGKPAACNRIFSQEALVFSKMILSLCTIFYPFDNILYTIVDQQLWHIFAVEVFEAKITCYPMKRMIER